MAGLWGSRKQEREARAAQDAELGRRADAALVAADERIRSTSDELAFAELELGTGPTAPLREALDAVKLHLQEAFQLNQLNHDDIPDTEEELRTRHARIVQLCDWAEELLDDRTQALAAPIEHARRAPEIVSGIQSDTAQLSARIPELDQTLERLRARYSDAALVSVARNPGEARQLLDFAAHGAHISVSRRESGQKEQANLALETAMEAVRRARSLIDAVDAFEVEAMRAETTLDAIVEDSRNDLLVARSFAATPAVAQASTALQQALDALPGVGAPADPFSQLTRLREANQALDAAVARARERAAHPAPPESQVRNAIADADRQLSVARNVIEGHRGWIGADARTRLAEADRLRQDLAVAERGPIDEDDRDGVLATARRCGMLAAEALQLAQRDIDSSRPGGWGGPSAGGGGGNNVVGGILGGLVIGSILDGIFN